MMTGPLTLSPFLDRAAVLEAAAACAPTAYPIRRNAIPPIEITEGRYALRLARTRAELDAALKLRFEVFNLELGEGLAASFRTGRDRDEFDAHCHHLIVEERGRGEIVGTYRLQTAEMAAAGRGFYAAAEFDLTRLPPDVLGESVELGRACIAPAHRHTPALFLLWRGIAAYALHGGKRYFFGCCSLTSQDARAGWRVGRWLERHGHTHPRFHTPVQPRYALLSEPDSGEVEDAQVPKLFRTYLRFGAKVCSPPAVDREFGTIDFLVLFDAAEMSEQARRLFFGL
jgi:putative hemolysin